MRTETSAWLQAVASFNARDFVETTSVASEGLATNPDEGFLWQLRGTALWMQSRYDEARADLETATCLTPLVPLAQCALADCYVRQGRLELALTIYDHLVAWRKTPIAFLPSLARALGRLGEHELALETCSRIVKHEPQNHAAHFGMAFYLHRVGASLEEILAALHEAFILAPRAMTYRLNLALVLAALHRDAEARALVQPIDIAALGCRCQVRILQGILHHLGDWSRFQICKRRLEELSKAKSAR